MSGDYQSIPGYNSSPEEPRPPPENPEYQGSEHEDNVENTDDWDPHGKLPFCHLIHCSHLVIISLLILLCIGTGTSLAIFMTNEDIRAASNATYLPPNITYCPVDMTRSSPLKGPTLVPVWWVEPSVANPSGDKISYEASHEPGDIFEIGNTTVTYNFTGDGGLLSICEFIVNVFVLDGSSPAINNCPQDIQADAPDNDNKVLVTWTEPTAESKRPVTTIKPDPDQLPGSYFSIGTTPINYVFVDSIGIHSTCAFLVSVLDVTPPLVYQCPNQISFTVPSENALKSVIWIVPEATDNSGTVSLVSQTHHPGDFFPVGSTAVQYVFTDPSGNINLCSFFIKGTVVSPNASTRKASNGIVTTTVAVIVSIFTVQQW